MTSENLLINKKFYETLLEGNQVDFPIQALGEAYLKEQKKEAPELAEIRYAQGEVYFDYKDYEAAIFKWENIKTELAPWAKKNVADAYYELSMLSTAEEMYKSIVSESLVLRSEVALQLFTLYIEEERFDLASRTVKELVSFHPNYPNVTEVARSFFEGQKDWKSAIDLALNESIRTCSLQWFDVLQSYVELGYTKDLEPSYFEQVLELLYSADQQRFEKLVLSLWNGYRRQDSYFSWLSSINAFFIQTEVNSYDSWSDLADTFKDTFLGLVDGRYFVKELEQIIPGLLENWLKLSDDTQVMYASAAVLSWNEIFSGSMNSLVVSDAENLLSQSRLEQDAYRESIELFEHILQWADKYHLNPGEKRKWLVRSMVDTQEQNILVVGALGSDKSSFVNALIGAEISEEATPAFLVVRDNDQPEILAINDSGISPIADLSEITQSIELQDSIYEVKFPSDFLHENRLTLIDTPELNRNVVLNSDFIQLTQAVDGLWYVLDAAAPYTERDRSHLMQIRKLAPKLTFHFVMNRMDQIFNEQDALRILDETTERIERDFPSAQVMPYSVRYNSEKQMKEASNFIYNHVTEIEMEQKRTDVVLQFIRQTLQALLEKRVEMENERIESIRWNEELVEKLSGAIYQHRDLEKDQIRVIKRAYNLIKEEVKNDLTATIPELLRECTDLVKLDSDFSHIHLTLNTEMNVRIHDYINRRALPRFYDSLSGWIVTSTEEFNQSQYDLSEMAEGLNGLYGEERIHLECDFKVLDDWRRDADRMASGVRIENVNILLRHTPSQLLLKGAGKLFSAIAQNKTALYTRYKKFLETMDYDDVSELIAKKFISQFELFEKSLERDIKLFFRGPKDILNTAVEQSNYEIQENQGALEKMRERPEVYHDPITLFEVRLHQFELMRKNN